MAPLIIRTLGVTKEDAAVLRVALAALLQQTVLSPEGRARARDLARKTDAILDSIAKREAQR